MKLLTSILLVAIFSRTENITKPKSVHLTISGHVVSIKKNSLQVQTILTNGGADTIQYWIMTCPDFWGFRVNQASFIIQGEEDCLKTIPKLITLYPFQSDTSLLRINVTPSLNNLNTKFKIGFNLVLKKADDIEWGGELIDKIHGKQNIIWSNQIVARRP